MLRLALLVLVFAAGPALAQVVSYEANSFPESEGWFHYDEIYPADRFIENGWLIQVAEILKNGAEERDTYRRSIAEFVGANSLFLEWIVQADGPSEAIPAVAPASMVAGEEIGDIYYHFTIADDQVRFIQDVAFPFVWADIAPNAPHVHRLELYCTEEFKWFIDGELIYTGVPEGAYPTDDAVVAFRCAAASVEAETVCSWDYIRYGTIPLDASGDFDSGGRLIRLTSIISKSASPRPPVRGRAVPGQI